MKINRGGNKLISIKELEPGDVFRRPKGYALYLVVSFKSRDNDYGVSSVNLETGSYSTEKDNIDVIKIDCEVIINE
jgi:hypothetical protein